MLCSWHDKEESTSFWNSLGYMTKRKVDFKPNEKDMYLCKGKSIMGNFEFCWKKKQPELFLHAMLTPFYHYVDCGH